MIRAWWRLATIYSVVNVTHGTLFLSLCLCLFLIIIFPALGSPACVWCMHVNCFIYSEHFIIPSFGAVGFIFHIANILRLLVSNSKHKNVREKWKEKREKKITAIICNHSEIWSMSFIFIVQFFTTLALFLSSSMARCAHKLASEKNFLPLCLTIKHSIFLVMVFCVEKKEEKIHETTTAWNVHTFV